MISKMITHTLILVLAASLCRTHEDLDVPLTQQMIGGLPPSAQTQGQPGYPPGLYPGVRPIGGCPGQYPPGLASQGGLGPYTGGGYPNQPLNGGEVIIPGNPQYQFPYYPQPGAPIYHINGQTYVPNNQYGTNTQQIGGPYNVPPCTKTLLETGVGDKSRAATSSDFPQTAYGIADQQDKNPTENILGGLYLAPYKPNCDNNSGRSSENEDTVPLQLYETRSAEDSPILTAVPVLHPHFAHGLNNYFHRFGFTKPMPHGGLVYSNTFSNHYHSNYH